MLVSTELVAFPNLELALPLIDPIPNTVKTPLMVKAKIIRLLKKNAISEHNFQGKNRRGIEIKNIGAKRIPEKVKIPGMYNDWEEL